MPEPKHTGQSLVDEASTSRKPVSRGTRRKCLPAWQAPWGCTLVQDAVDPGRYTAFWFVTGSDLLIGLTQGGPTLLTMHHG